MREHLMKEVMKVVLRKMKEMKEVKKKVVESN